MKIVQPDSQQDLEQLRLLSIFHYVVGAMVGLFSLFPLIHVGIGIAIVTGAFDDPNQPPPPEFLGWIFIIVPGMMILFGMTVAFCMILAGRNLNSRSSHLFCVIVAGVECLFMPFGTVLGVFTIIVLSRPSVKELFGGVNKK